MCGSVSSLFDTRWHTRLLRLLFGRRARTRCLWGGNLRALWAVLYEKAPFSSVPLFEERGSAVCFPWFGNHRVQGTEENEIVGHAGGSGRWVREGAFWKLPYWWSGPEVSSEVSWNLLGLQVILVCKSLGNPIGPFQDLFMRLLVEPALLPSP